MAVDLEYYGVPPADYREQELRNTITTSAGQTTISAPYSIGYVDVYFNGAKLDRYTEFTATDGATIVLATAATAGDTVEVISRAQVQVANVYTQQQVNALLVPYFGTATGTGDAQILVTTPSFTSYVDGMDVKVRTVAQNSTTAPTINCNGAGAKTIVSNNAGAAVYGKDWVAGSEITLRYNQTLGKFILLDGMTTTATPAQLDNSNQSATTAFLKANAAQFVDFINIVGNTTLNLTHLGKVVTVPGSITVTLPAANSVPAGSAFYLRSPGSNATDTSIATNGTDTITMGFSTNTAATLPRGMDIVLVSTGAVAWVNMGGSATVANWLGANASFAATGYQKFPGGTIFQWGTYSSSSTSNPNATVTFPLAFPNACFQVNPTVGGSSLGTWVVQTTTTSKTGATLSCQNNSATVSGFGGTYIAIGY